MQQRLSSDVEIKQGNRTTQFGESQPGPDKVGLVAQKERHRVSLSQVRLLPQHPGQPVAAPVHLPVGEALPLEVQEGLGRVSPGRHQKGVQDGVERLAPLIQDEPGGELEAPQDVHAVVKPVWEASPEDEHQAAHDRQPDEHRESEELPAAR